MKKKKKIKAENKKNKKNKKDEDLFDDDNCPVCRAMKFAQENGKMPTLSELKEAFQKSKNFKINPKQHSHILQNVRML